MYQKTPHIIIDGVDKAGKSTLARELSSKFGMPIKKFSAPLPGESPFKDYTDFIVNEKKPHIIDRCYMSELVYGPIKRGKSSINETEKILIEAALKYNNVMCVWASGEEADIIQRMEKDGETFLQPNEVGAVIRGFQREVAQSILKWYPYVVGVDMDFLAAYYETYHKEESDETI